MLARSCAREYNLRGYATEPRHMPRCMPGRRQTPRGTTMNGQPGENRTRRASRDEPGGFSVRSPEPDCEGMLYYRAARPVEAQGDGDPLPAGAAAPGDTAVLDDLCREPPRDLPRALRRG
jgi:hypothetical protein